MGSREEAGRAWNDLAFAWTAWEALPPEPRIALLELMPERRETADDLRRLADEIEGLYPPRQRIVAGFEQLMENLEEEVK